MKRAFQYAAFWFLYGLWFVFFIVPAAIVSAVAEAMNPETPSTRSRALKWSVAGVALACFLWRALS